MKFLIVGDLHGHDPKIHFKGFDALIAPGDFCSDAPRSHMFAALKHNLENPGEKRQWYHLTGKRAAHDMIRKSLADGRSIMKHLDSYGVPVYEVPGNWDWTASPEKDWKYLHQDHYQTLINGLDHIVDVHHKLVDIGDYQIIGHGIISGPEYPQGKDLKRFSKKELAAKRAAYQKQYAAVDHLFKQATKPVIFISHNVPYNTPIDQINNEKSPRNGEHFGSLIARQMIDKYQPLVCIGGHMHEHFTSCKVGETVCINAGFGAEVNVLLELENGKIKDLKFHGKTAV